ncbi:MAG: DUF177 domain-containing protein [Blautia sp.]|nr:DUF177 domain-containing protein [Blautia sp.]
MQAEPEIREIAAGGEAFEILEKQPVCLTVTNIGKGRAKVEGQTEIVLSMRCDRCLKPVGERLALQFSREVHAPDTALARQDEEADDDQNFMEGYQLNLEELLNNEIIINWPSKILCSADCKGICMQCGKDLNTGTCECDTFIPDPRMAVIKDIFNADKEV